jgi:hypothetical protein
LLDPFLVGPPLHRQAHINGFQGDIFRSPARLVGFDAEGRDGFLLGMLHA